MTFYCCYRRMKTLTAVAYRSRRSRSPGGRRSNTCVTTVMMTVTMITYGIYAVVIIDAWTESAGTGPYRSCVIVASLSQYLSFAGVGGRACAQRRGE